MPRAKPVIVPVQRRPARRREHARNPVTISADATQGVSEITDGHTVFRLRRPVDLSVDREGSGFLIGYEPLGIQEYGRTKRAALEAFAYHVGALWEGIAQADDWRLSRDTRRLKRQMQDLVDSVSLRA